MKPEAIVHAATEVLTAILATPQPANEVLSAYTRSRRYIGSKDRRTLSDLVWGYLRHYRRLQYAYPDATTAERLAKLDTLPDTITGAPPAVNWEVPDWLISLIPSADVELPALLQAADIVLRTNGDRNAIQKMLSDQGVPTEETPLSPWGLRLTKRVNLNIIPAYRDGLIEVQDEGSQCVALATGIRAGNTVLDYCAGAGGKSLIFAQMMQNRGSITAHDISSRSLAELKKRANRAGATCITVQRPLKAAMYDHVVVDAPCSGTGTWRRCPDMRFKLTADQLEKLVHTQADILDKAVSYVKTGGFLSYMTCSLTYPENAGQTQTFLQRHPGFTLVQTKQFSPAQTHTDGLFLAQFQRTR